MAKVAIILMAEFNREEALKRKAEIAFKLHECKKHQNGRKIAELLRGINNSQETKYIKNQNV